MKQIRLDVGVCVWVITVLTMLLLCVTLYYKAEMAELRTEVATMKGTTPTELKLVVPNGPIEEEVEQ